MLLLFHILKDENIKARLAPYAEIVHKAEEEVIGESLTTLDFESCVSGECALGDILADAMTEFVSFLSFCFL